MAIPIIGGIIDKVIEKGGDIISELVTDKDLAAKLDHEFRSLVTNHEAEFKQLELEAEAEMFKSQQEVIKAELHQTDLYTKQTRPRIARKSFYLALGYVLLCMFDATIYKAFDMTLEEILELQQDLNWGVFMVMVSPCLTYMGVRSFDKWKKPT
jgi:hypothetical protein